MALERLMAEPTTIKGLWKVAYKLSDDERGSMLEFYRHTDFLDAGMRSLGQRPQTNMVTTVKGGLRGIHAEAMDTLLAVTAGQIYAVIVDLRPESRTAGRWLTFELERGQGLFMLQGLGISFQSMSDEPSVCLQLTSEEKRPEKRGITCNPLDADLGIPWPIGRDTGMILAHEDASSQSVNELLGR